MNAVLEKLFGRSNSPSPHGGTGGCRIRYQIQLECSGGHGHLSIVWPNKNPSPIQRLRSRAVGLQARTQDMSQVRFPTRTFELSLLQVSFRSLLLYDNAVGLPAGIAA